MKKLGIFDRNKNRIWEIDFLRGFLILLVTLDHFMFDLSLLGVEFDTQFGKALYEFSLTYYAGNETVLGVLRVVLHYRIVMLFVFISGMSSSFSKNNLKRGLFLAAVAIAFTLFMELARVIGLPVSPMRFNIIHVLAICILIYALIEFLYKKFNKVWQQNLILGLTGLLIAVALIFGYYFLQKNYDGSLIGAFFFHANDEIVQNFSAGDYLSLFPALGWFLIGAWLSKKLYRERKTLFPTVNTKYVAPISFIGRYTIILYFGLQLLLYGLIYIITLF